MTEQEYEKLVEDAAWERLKIIARYLDDKQLKYLREGDKSETVKTWRNAVKWARENPPPEVQALIDESKNAEYWLRYAKYQTREAEHAACKVWTELCKCLASFKERTAGKGEE